jgi:hypothetical protein
LLEFGVRWKRSWPSAAIMRAQIFSYRDSGATSTIGEMASE